jgi:hypothetical protein
MNLIQIRKHINDGDNLLFYNKDVFNYYDELYDDFTCIYLNEPTPVKPRLIMMIEKISGSNNPALKRLTISELRDFFLKEVNYKCLVIFFNHFERLTKKSVEVYQYLNSLDNIHFICSFKNNFKPEIYNFFKTFILVNKEEYSEKSGGNEINITYAMYALLSFFCFIIYLKMTSNLTMAILAIGGVWFALMIFRTLMFAGGRA